MSATSGGGSTDAVRDLWDRAVERVKKVAFSPVLYRALERTVPVAWEEGAFVVGFSGTDGQMAGAMNTGEHLATIERALRAVSGDPNVRLRVIEGSTYQDWQHVKERDSAAATSRAQTFQKRSSESATFNSWEQVYEQVSRLWANFEYRSLPTGRGRYLAAAFDLVITAMADGLYPTDGKADEPTERGLSRILERIAGMTNSDPALIGLLLWERWTARQKQK
jgi:hypothetical protein